MISRFFSWPKTVLFGNEFLYKKNTILKEQPLSNVQSFVTREKMPSTRYPVLKVFAVILYPVFNPIAFGIKKINSFLNPDLAENLARYKTESTASKQTLRRNFDSQYRTLEAKQAYGQFDVMESKVNQKWFELAKKIKKTEDWKEHEKELLPLFSEAAQSFDLLSIAIKKMIEQDIAHDKSTHSPKEFAERMVAQAQALPKGKTFTKPFGHTFPLTTLIDMYHKYRSCVYFEEKKEKYISCDDGKQKEELTLRLHFSSPKINLHTNAKEFYTQPTTAYQCRQTYNLHMKFFFGLFGGEKFRSVLHQADNRFDVWSRIDTSKNETSFSPHPGTRPT